MLVASAGIASAQNRTTAELVGVVTDPTGAAVPSVSILVTNLQTNQVGYYDVPFLQPGFYSMTFEMAGFQSVECKNIELQLGQTARMDTPLTLGATKSAIVIEAAAPLINTDDSQRGANFSSTMVGSAAGRPRSFLAAPYSDGVMILCCRWRANWR